MRLSELLADVRRRLHPRYRVIGETAIPVRHMHARINLAEVRETARIEREQDQLRWLYYRRRLTQDCGLTEARAKKYYRRAYPTGLAKVWRDEVRGLIRDLKRTYREAGSL
jgi:hypothetical protein